MARKIEVQIVGDASKLEKAFGKASSSASRFGSSMQKAGKYAAIAAGAGIAAVGYGLKKSIDAAIEAEKAETRLASAFKAADVAAKSRGQAMETVAKVSARAALDDEDLMDSLGRLVRVTGDAAKAQRDLGIAADISRARGIELEAATKIVEKAELGQLGALKRIGIEIPKVTAAQDALKESGIKATAEQVKAAKAADDIATRQAAIAALQTQYAGAAERYGTTAAGAQERFRVAVENLQEAVGAKLLPVVTRFLTWVVANMPTFERVASQVFQKVGAVIDALRPTFSWLQTAIQSVARFSQQYWPQVQAAAQRVVAWYQGTLRPAIQNVISALQAIWAKFGADITRIATTAFNTARAVITAAMRVIQGVVEGVLAAIRGDWSQVWNSLKQVVSNVLKGVSALLKGFTSIAFQAMAAVGRALIDGIIAGASGLAERIGGFLRDQIQRGLDSAKSFFGIKSPSTYTRDQIGKPLAEGIVVGMDGGLALLAPKMQERIKQAMDRVKTQIDAAKTRLGTAMSGLSDKLLRAFDAKTGGTLTPAEQEIAAINARRRLDDLNRALQEARETGDAALVARAQEDLHLHSLEQQAQQERKAWDDERAALRERLEGRLSTLGKHFAEEGTTVAKAMLKINEIMRAFGITFAESGVLVGKHFAAGLASAVGGAAVGAGGVRGALTGGDVTPKMPAIVTQVLLDGKVVAETVRKENAVYARSNGVLAV